MCTFMALETIEHYKSNGGHVLGQRPYHFYFFYFLPLLAVGRIGNQFVGALGYADAN